jgi:hypothetical protein
MGLRTKPAIKKEKTMRFSRIAFAILASILPSAAHLDGSSLKPVGGESYKPGSTVTIEWIAEQAHNGLYDIYFSRDGGKTWPTEFAEGWQGPKTDGAKASYRWTIPANTANTTQARIRVCQLFGGHCVQPGVYTLISKDFTISNTSGVAGGAAFAGAPVLDFDSRTHSVQLSLGLASAARVSLKAFDAAGREVADLLDRGLESGRHRFSISSPRLGSAGPLVFRLEGGSEVRTWNWSGLP